MRPDREDAAGVFAEAEVGDRLAAVRAEAHALPFDAESFDAIVSIDAFEYFGTADGYLPYLPLAAFALTAPRHVDALGRRHPRRPTGMTFASGET